MLSTMAMVTAVRTLVLLATIMAVIVVVVMAVVMTTVFPAFVLMSQKILKSLLPIFWRQLTELQATTHLSCKAFTGRTTGSVLHTQTHKEDAKHMLEVFTQKLSDIYTVTTTAQPACMKQGLECSGSATICQCCCLNFAKQLG